jgi:predicted nuclease of predicted toxin-antitoxin system
MRLLADENFPRPLIDFLRDNGHDVLWAGIDLASGKDSLLLDFAESEGRILLTLDKDFWQIALQRRTPVQRSGVVLFRFHPANPSTLLPLVRTFIEAERTWAGHVSAITVKGIEMVALIRPL